MMDFIGTGLKLTPGDIAFAAKQAGIPLLALGAVISVETAGAGFDHLNRPTMLFEPHQFYNAIKGGDPSVLSLAVANGLATEAWDPHGYPLDSYPRLQLAAALNQDAALRSASWGLGQVMGFNHQMVGFATVADMVRDAMLSEANQLSQMLRFIRSQGLTHALISQDWATFAEGYNGGGQVSVYASKLAVAFRSDLLRLRSA